MSERIAVVVVTYNRLVLLKECIEGIQKQTQPYDKLIIVNNGSTDGTSEYLQSIENETTQIIHQENVGGAGGFHTAIKTAYEQGFDWVWMMDDDVEAKPDCLAKLLQYKYFSKCLHPNKQYIDGKDFGWEHFYNPFRGEYISLHNTSFKNNKEIFFLNAGCFEGMLIHRSVVDKIGFPNPDYFIFGDDLEYGFLANLYTNVSCVKDALLIRKKTFVEEKPTLFLYYYGIRNRHLLKKTMQKYLPIGKWYDLYTLQIVIQYVSYTVFRQTGGLKMKMKYLKALYKGVRDGIKGISGKTYLKF